MMADKKEQVLVWTYEDFLMLRNTEFPCKVLQCSNIAFLQNFVSYLADFLQDSQGFVCFLA